MKSNSQSTTHIAYIDQQGGTGGGEIQAPACSVSDKGPGLRLKLLLMFQLNPHNSCSLHNPSQVHFQNMCNFHG